MGRDISMIGEDGDHGEDVSHTPCEFVSDKFLYTLRNILPILSILPVAFDYDHFLSTTRVGLAFCRYPDKIFVRFS